MAVTTKPGILSHSSSSSYGRWDVYLSFLGEDTQKNFISHLYAALVQAGIRTFREDDEDLDVAPELLDVVQGSKMSIVVFSKNYASSAWCLDEVVQLVKCKRSTRRQLVIPVYYDVEPSEVRYQTGRFGDAFEKHSKHFVGEMDKVDRWRAALTEVVNLSGFDLNNSFRDEADLISKIVKTVVEEVCPPRGLIDAEHLVGIDSRVEDIHSKLCIGLNDVRFVGIYGMTGIGKTTIVKDIYNKASHLFESSCFLENVGKAIEDSSDLLPLLEQLIWELLKNKNFKVPTVERGISLLKEELRSKRVLIVLDDLPELISQLKSLAGHLKWFGSGSRIIITTRDVSLLRRIPVDLRYKVKKLNMHESLELFSWHAFQNHTPPGDFMGISKAIVSFIGGLPLDLEVIGECLFQRTKQEWRSFVPHLHQSFDNEMHVKFLTNDALEMFNSVIEPEFVEVHPYPTVAIKNNIKTSVEPSIPVEKSQLLLPSNEKNDESSPIDKVEVEKHGPTPGDQTSPKPVIYGKRSIYQTVEKILGCLRDGTSRRIGIYGSGGIGKTTVLKALYNHTEAQEMFDSIIWVTVSRYSSAVKIQNQVAEQVFSRPAGSDTNSEAAFRRENVLFLLDDVVEKIDLAAMGIPNPNQEKGCRIILTTRSLYVCNLMAVDTQFEMDIISTEEAWELFHDQVGEIIDFPDIEPYARAIVAACGGLPLTIVVTGRALREENNASMWQHALLEFLSLIASSKHGIKAEIQKLKFGYNKLKSRDVKDCFLYCALIQEDHGVNISELVKYLSYEDLVARSLADPYEKAHSIVKILLNASLLERTDDGVSVKMHDIIRELALVIMSPEEEEGCQFLVRADIRLTLEPEDPNCSAVDVNVESEFLNRSASEGHQFLLGASAGLTEPPANEKWEQAKMIFLMDNDLSSLPDNLSCPKLLTLCFQRNNRLRVIPKSFFVGMPHLQILNLSGTRINSLPPSLFKLKLLKVLLLHDCKRFSMLSPEIGALEHLELLDLRETEIYNLPNAIASLTCLKHLLVSFYGTSNSSEFAKLPTELISKGIISRLLQLNELSIDVYPGDQRWSRGMESVANEVLNLKELKNLSFYFPEVNLLELFIQESPSWKNKGLTKFKFIVGHNVKRIVARVTEDVEFVYNQQDRCLRFVNGETVPSAVVKVLSFSTAFYLDHHLNIQSLSELGVSNINALEVCIVRECHEIKAVIHSKGAENSTLTTFPVLEILVIHYLWNLRSIWAGPMPRGSLSRLKFLSVHTCPQLPFVLTSSMLQNLYNLEVLEVEDCQAVTNVILEKRDVASGYVVLPKLRKLRLHYLPNLVSIWKGTWPSVEHISFYNCPNLKSLPFSFELIKSIKEIKAEKMWWDELIWEDTSLYLQLQAHFTEISYEDF